MKKFRVVEPYIFFKSQPMKISGAMFKKQGTSGLPEVTDNIDGTHAVEKVSS